MVALYIVLCALLVWVLLRSKELTLSEFVIACVILVPMLIIESQIVVDAISLSHIVPEKVLGKTFGETRIHSHLCKTHSYVNNLCVTVCHRVYHRVYHELPKALKGQHLFSYIM